MSLLISYCWVMVTFVWLCQAVRWEYETTFVSVFVSKARCSLEFQNRQLAFAPIFHVFISSTWRAPALSWWYWSHALQTCAASPYSSSPSSLLHSVSFAERVSPESSGATQNMRAFPTRRSLRISSMGKMGECCTCVRFDIYPFFGGSMSCNRVVITRIMTNGAIREYSTVLSFIQKICSAAIENIGYIHNIHIFGEFEF